MSVKLLTEHHLEFLSLKGGFTGWSESIHVKMPHCWKPHVAAHFISSTGDKWKIRRKMLTPTFHFKILHDFVHVFNDQSKVLLSKLKTQANGKPYNIFNDVTLCALDIICGR